MAIKMCLLEGLAKGPVPPTDGVDVHRAALFAECVLKEEKRDHAYTGEDRGEVQRRAPAEAVRQCAANERAHRDANEGRAERGKSARGKICR